MEKRDSATETDAPLTSRALALFAATIPSERIVDDFVAKMPPEIVPVLVARTVAVRKALQYVEKAGETRLAEEKIILFGGLWVDPETGIVHTFGGAPGEYEVADPEGLRAALRATGKVSPTEIDVAVRPAWKIDNVQLNLLCRRDASVREVIEDFRTRKPFGPAHLREART